MSKQYYVIVDEANEIVGMNKKKEELEKIILDLKLQRVLKHLGVNLEEFFKLLKEDKLVIKESELILK